MNEKVRNWFKKQLNTIRGRYPEVVLGGSPVSVNYYAYRDYITNRKALRDRNARKRVKPFDPAEVARLCPIVREIIVMEDEDD